MGQTSSGERVPEWAEVQRQASNFKELAFLSYDAFINSLKELNRISQTYKDGSGKRLMFAVKRGSDSTMLWKATVRIGCVRVDTESKQIKSYRLLNLKQYMHVHQLIMCQVASQSQTESRTATNLHLLLDGANSRADRDLEPTTDGKGGVTCPCASLDAALTTSALFDKVLVEEPIDECCICMERKPEVILPCAHNYCMPCIEQWNVTNKTCPVCREVVDSTNDSWVISEAPDSSEMAAEVQKLLNGLSEVSEEESSGHVMY